MPPKLPQPSTTGGISTREGKAGIL
jgi:hypothetical protein